MKIIKKNLKSGKKQKLNIINNKRVESTKTLGHKFVDLTQYKYLYCVKLLFLTSTLHDIIIIKGVKKIYE